MRPDHGVVISRSCPPDRRLGFGVYSVLAIVALALTLVWPHQLHAQRPAASAPKPVTEAMEAAPEPGNHKR